MIAVSLSQTQIFTSVGQQEFSGCLNRQVIPLLSTPSWFDCTLLTISLVSSHLVISESTQFVYKKLLKQFQGYRQTFWTADNWLVVNSN